MNAKDINRIIAVYRELRSLADTHHKFDTAADLIAPMVADLTTVPSMWTGTPAMLAPLVEDKADTGRADV